MNQKKTGELIRSLRKERGLTQQQLACRMSISDKTVSKWERGAGSPDLSMFPLLSELFGVEIDVLLSGELNSNDQTGGNMKRLLTLVLALAMVLSLAACGSKKPVQLTADGGAVVVLSADANNAVTSLSVAFRKQLAAKLVRGGRFWLLSQLYRIKNRI